MKAQERQGLRAQDRKAFNLISESFVKFSVWVKTMFAWNFVCATSARTSPFLYDNLRNYFIIAYKSSNRANKVDITNPIPK